MKNVSLILTAIFIATNLAFGQGTAINKTGAAAHNSALLDVSDTTKGILIPRMTKVNKLAISSPANGLLIYQTNDTTGFWYFNGMKWAQFAGSGSGSIPAGNNTGDMLYWNGTQWTLIPAGANSSTLKLCNGIPTWGNCVPSLSTDAASNILPFSATSGGSISNDGGAPITARGVCRSTSPNPTTANSKTNDGTGTGSFVSNIGVLISSTTYYVRAYATNSVGTGYGNEISFTTTACVPGSSIGPAGGKVFYDKGSYSNGWRYLEAGPTDAGNSTWGCYSGFYNITDWSIGQGQNNTNAMIANGCSNAAHNCDGYSAGGYDDWFLPAQSEMLQMYNVGAVGGNYWSSSEQSSQDSWFINGSGQSSTYTKFNYLGVRCARDF